MITAHVKKEGIIYMTSGSTASTLVTSSDLDANTWHRRLGHMSEKGIKAMLSKGKQPGLKSINLDFYKDCVYGKQSKFSFSKVEKAPKAERLELVHTNLWGEAYVPSVGDSLYFVTFIDDASRKVWIYFSKQKLDVFDVFKK